VMDEPVAVVLVGDVTGTLIATDGNQRPLPAWQATLLRPGDLLRIGAPRSGIGYLGVSGGILTPPLLGSRSTYRRAGMGRFLLTGDLLPCGPASLLGSAPSWRHDDRPVRLLAGPQQDHFPPESIDRLYASPYLIASDSDRMGLRLSGPALRHNEKGAEIATDGVLPGVLQVPADGQPILLLADAQTTGGYAKIGTVISADLPRLAHLRPGAEIRFQQVDRTQARQALRDNADRFDHWRRAISDKPPGQIDNDALYRHNLISGATLGEDEETGS
jgi:biotin-dependent carboxylase-like uncharacterized protein